MKWLLRVGAVVLLTLGLVSSVFAATGDGQTAATAIALPTSLSASGSFAGTTVGGFNFYTFDNPSSGTTGNFSLKFTPTDSTTANAVGVNLYQNGARLLAMNGLSPTPGSNASNFSTATAGPILVQMYNYLPGSVVSYSFTVTGIATPTTEVATPVVATPTPVPLGSTDARPIMLPASLSASGMQVGNASGAFTFYAFNYPGNGEVGTITLNVAPTDPNLANYVGVNLYLDGTNVLSMNSQSLTAGQKIGTFSSTTSGTVLLEVYNYNPFVTYTYNFTVSGITP
jgi:hypothetical protein